MDNIIAISHIADLDGIACGALIKMKYGIATDKILYLDYSKEALIGAERALSKMNLDKATLFITDLGANDEKADIFVRIIKMIKKGGGKVCWYDHHPWGKTAASKIVPLCDDIVYGEQDRCASEITLERLGLDNAFVKHLSKICHASDFNLKPANVDHMTTIKNYAIGIAYYNTKPSDVALKKLYKLTDQLANGKLKNKEIANAAMVFERINERRIKIMVKSLHLIGSNIAVGFQHALQSTNACESIMRHAKRDVGIFINVDKGRGNMRSKKANISPLAMALGGGGHPHASGFEIDQKQYLLNTKKGRDMLLSRISDEAARLGI